MSWVLITGGAKRLGAEIALKLAENGYDLVIHYRNSEKEACAVAEKCKKFGVKAETIQGNFSTIEGINAFLVDYLARFAKTRILINNVGSYFVGSLIQTSVEEWYSLFQINLHTPFLLSKGLRESLIAQQGSIINIGVSGVQKNAANSYCSAYMLAKETLLGFTRSLGSELAPDCVKVNMISPGILDISEDVAFFRDKVPMKKNVQSKEIANAILFLIDETNPSITGQNIEIAGGFGLK